MSKAALVGLVLLLLAAIWGIFDCCRDCRAIALYEELLEENGEFGARVDDAVLIIQAPEDIYAIRCAWWCDQHGATRGITAVDLRGKAFMEYLLQKAEEGD